MEQAFEKLGIYDLVAVLMSGLCISTITVFVGAFLWSYEISTIFAEVNTLCFLIVSYLVGVVFQEIGSFLMKKKYPIPDLLDKAIKESPELNSGEIEQIRKIVKAHLKDDNATDEQVYNFCRYYLISKGKFSRADNNQSIAGFGRSISVYLVLLGALSIIWALHYVARVQLIPVEHILAFVAYLAIICFTCWIFSHRCMRFTKMRYVQILRSFFYYYSIYQTK